MSKPVVNEADDKPTDRMIVYGAELKPIAFILDVYLDDPSVDDRLIFSKLHMAISSLVAQATNNDSAYAIEYYQDYYEQDYGATTGDNRLVGTVGGSAEV